MNSPIKTVISNKTNRLYAITCIPRRRIVINPGKECVIPGDIFSLCENTRSVETLLGQMVNGNIDIYFIVDSVFQVKAGEDVLTMNTVVRKGLTDREVLLRELAEGGKVEEKEEPKEEPKESADSANSQEKSDEEMKLDELASEGAKEEKIEEAPMKEEPKEEKIEESLMKEEPKEDKQPAPAKAAEKSKASKKIQVK